MLGPLPSTPVHINWLLWAKSKNRSTGAIEASGIWTGAITRLITVAGEARTYYGSGNVLDVSNMNFVAGTNSVQPQTIVLNGLTPEVEAMIRGYEAKQAEIEIHRWYHSPKLRTGGTIERAIKGRIDKVEFARPAVQPGETPGILTCTLTIMTAARRGTKTLALMKSDASHRMAFPNDAGRKYSSSTAKVVWMGEVKNPYRARRGQ